MEIGGRPRNGTMHRKVRPVGAAQANRAAGRGQERSPSPGKAGRASSPGLPVPVAGAPDRPHPPALGASAPLLAQLIATRLGLPQTRRLRRGSHEEAEQAYRGAERLRGGAHRRRPAVADGV